MITLLFFSLSSSPTVSDGFSLVSSRISYQAFITTSSFAPHPPYPHPPYPLSSTSEDSESPLYIPKKERMGPGITSAFPDAQDYQFDPLTTEENFLASLSNDDYERYNIMCVANDQLAKGEIEKSVLTFKAGNELVSDVLHYDPSYPIALYYYFTRRGDFPADEGASLNDAYHEFFQQGTAYQKKYDMWATEERIWAAGCAILLKNGNSANVNINSNTSMEPQNKETRKLERCAMELFEAVARNSDDVDIDKVSERAKRASLLEDENSSH